MFAEPTPKTVADMSLELTEYPLRALSGQSDRTRLCFAIGVHRHDFIKLLLAQRLLGRSLLARSGLSGCGAPLSKIELMKDDAAAVLKMGEEIKARYTKIFRV
jgi:hypothetical protein